MARGQETSGTYRMMQIGGRTLRVATWRLDEPLPHPPLLFFNGIGANIEAVAALADRLGERGFVIFDMPGTGGSPDPALPYTPAAMAWTACRLLDRLGLGAVDVMGFSWGGVIAQQFALQHPSRTRRLVLAASNAGMATLPGDPLTLARMADPRSYVDVVFMAEQFTAHFGAAGGAEVRSRILSKLQAPSPLGYLYQLLALAGWSSLPALAFLRAETLVVTGAEDPIVPPINGQLLAAAIPRARLEVLRGAGHLFLLTHDRASAALIREFLDAPAAGPALARAA